jgi:hypothetical protein
LKRGLRGWRLNVWRRLWLGGTGRRLSGLWLSDGPFFRQLGLAAEVAVRLLFGEIDARLCSFHFNARDEHHWAARAELHAHAGMHLRWLHEPLAVDECSVGGLRVNEQAATVLGAKLCVAARHHRPLGLIEDEMTLGRVAPDLHHRLLKNAFRFLLIITLFN